MKFAKGDKVRRTWSPQDATVIDINDQEQCRVRWAINPFYLSGWLPVAMFELVDTGGETD